MNMHSWLDKKQRSLATWFGRKFRRINFYSSKPILVFICDFEGHYTGFEDAAQFAEQGTDQLLTLLRRHQISMTFDTVAELCLSHPERVKKIIAAGHEIACHGWRHECPRQLNHKQLHEMLHQTKICFNQLGVQAKGFRSPESAWSMALMKALPQHGYCWSAERGKETFAYYITKDLIRIPVADDDWALNIGAVTAEQLFSHWKNKLDTAIQENGIACFGIHEWIFAKFPEYAVQLDYFIQYAKDKAVILPMSAAIQKLTQA